ncbi:Uncharacterised protein [Mycobacteroides abscessus subsp. massiliense]|uniref:DUF4333 domain-containing protein n=2 Tax=Mycobacteroides abscessus TaxID=36809 RepID=UPI00092C5AF7|nr:DUF4333 domain-containing protein [Mycobacteroides abscessus]MDB2215850.1 DUF4333 domain-containing protein [Mycobacteroides abscessus subsp. massiliense]MDO3141516.1 DUF4333 domain-containing protein [Mycobacteroides abscessus subsp. massiliense]MDO3302001.1 DUF4333 domain-containing protein [Mycobacteroides abscessus subsp. massiliense]SIE58897.1 Uncharacterised protein [Mycobacteroides abscessus subsp. abscessus]SKM80480.1 Uncharacterised protein [Mycobacteroides abscessus subsp. massili
MTIHITSALKLFPCVALLVSPMALSACGSDEKTTSLSKDALEADLEDIRGWENNPFADSVSKAVCRGGIKLQKGARQTCDITLSSKTHTLTVVINDARTNPPIFGVAP